MKFTPTKLEGCFILEQNPAVDERGYFMESFNQNVFNEGIGSKVDFVQDNQSFSYKNVLRGLHYQTGEHAQAKLVRVVVGEVLDVAVDIRPGSATYGQHVAVLLSEENKKQLFVPKGFAHGFLVLSDNATFCYKCDRFYNKESEGGIIYNDPTININWPVEKPIVFGKDAELPLFENAKKIW